MLPRMLGFEKFKWIFGNENWNSKNWIWKNVERRWLIRPLILKDDWRKRVNEKFGSKVNLNTRWKLRNHI